MKNKIKDAIKQQIEKDKDAHNKFIKDAFYEFIKDVYKDAMPDQRSLLDQLIDLHKIANYVKMYDAADYLQEKISRVIKEIHGG